MNGHPPPTPEAILCLTLVTDPWLSCDNCFDQIDTAVEALIVHGTRLDEPFRVHLIGCSACYDEALGLAQLIAPEFAVAAAQASEILRTVTSAPEGTNE
jgi:hypothetical protein